MTGGERLRRRLLLGIATALCGLASAADTSGPLVIFAASSLREAHDEVALHYRNVSGRPVKPVYGASGTLARQVEKGAPAWVFISADPEWMDYLERAGKLLPNTRSNLLGNDLVLVSAADSKLTFELQPGADLAKALGKGRLAIGNPETVAAGRYAKAALASFGMWDGVQGRLAPMENVRAALALVARGEAPAGIVYRTDALAEPRVRVLATFPASSHPPIVYSVALTAEAGKNEYFAARYLSFLRLPQAREAWVKHGFRVLP